MSNVRFNFRIDDGSRDLVWRSSFPSDALRIQAIITDDRPDVLLGRPHREIGEKIAVPNHKIKWDD